MGATPGAGEKLVERIRARVADAGVGASVLGYDLAELGLIEVSVSDGTATVRVTLPVAGSTLRDRLARELRAAALGLADIEDAHVQWTPAVPDPGVRVDLVPEVKNVIAVSSGKGGVGKSTVAANLAVALADAGCAVGLLDADVYGPNAPAMLGVDERTPRTTRDDAIVPWEAHGVSVMSMGFVTGEDDPIIWRGPMVDDALEQLFRDVRWGALDYLIVDLPPGTGDAQLSLVQHLPLSGAIVVTTPQPVAVDDARRGLRGFRRYDVPILGVVENMSGFSCPDCGAAHEIFGAGGAETLGNEFEVPVLGRIPLDPAIGMLDSPAETEPGLAVPGLGRLQLPRTREQRERSKTLPPIAIREGGEGSRTAAEAMATRVAAEVDRLVKRRGHDDGS